MGGLTWITASVHRGSVSGARSIATATAACLGGLDALGWYHEKQDDAHGIGLGPEHDWASHAADAFGLMSIAYEEPAGEDEEDDDQRAAFGDQGRSLVTGY